VSRGRMQVRVEVVVFAIRAGKLRVLLAPSDGSVRALPGGIPGGDESLEEAARRILGEATGNHDLYLEQLYTFSEPRRAGAGGLISVAYFAIAPGAGEQDAAGFFPAHRPPRLVRDHGRILALGVERLRTKTEYSTVPLRFLDEPFTLSEVQAVYEVLLDRALDKRNFRRKMLALEAIEETAGRRRVGAHRPARLFRLSPARPYLLKERGILFPF